MNNHQLEADSDRLTMLLRQRLVGLRLLYVRESYADERVGVAGRLGVHLPEEGFPCP